MPIAFVQRRKWTRLRAAVAATFVCPDKRTLRGEISDISEHGIGFTLDENVQYLEGITVRFWLPFDPARPNDTMLEPIVVGISPVSSRYYTESNSYRYGAVFLGLSARVRNEIRTYLERAGPAAAQPFGPEREKERRPGD